jgi:aspartate racemase
LKSELYIGLLGLGKDSTSFYLDRIKSEWNKKYGSENECPIVVHPVDFEKINALLPCQFDQLEPIIEKHLFDLNKLEVDRIIVPNITLHLTIDRLELSSEMKAKIVHPFRETIRYLKTQDIKEITLFGTRHTMNSEMVKTYFSTEGFQIRDVSEVDIEQIDQLRLDVFDNGANKNAQFALSELAIKYPNPVLMCTELSLINTNCLDVVTCQVSGVFN